MSSSNVPSANVPSVASTDSYAVRCVDSKLVEPLTGFVTCDSLKGLKHGPEQYAQLAYAALLNTSNHKDVLRSAAENDEALKQIIPYVTVRRDGKFLIYQRQPNATETRLASKWSIGFGGHVHAGESLWEGMIREVKEELGIGVGTVQFIGVVNDNSTPVARVHIGLVYVLDMDGVEPTLGSEIAASEWLTPAELISKFSIDEAESWSYLISRSITLFSD